MSRRWKASPATLASGPRSWPAAWGIKAGPASLLFRQCQQGVEPPRKHVLDTSGFGPSPPCRECHWPGILPNWPDCGDLNCQKRRRGKLTFQDKATRQVAPTSTRQTEGGLTERHSGRRHFSWRIPKRGNLYLRIKLAFSKLKRLLRRAADRRVAGLRALLGRSLGEFRPDK